MSKPLYIAYFAINPYGEDVPTQAMDAARKALEDKLGGAWQVLAAKAAFEEAGGLPAYWAGSELPSIVRWTRAAQAALNAAFKAEPPRQATIEDLEQLDEACIDVISAAHYAYTPEEWLVVFTAHFGMSDHCESHEQALEAARHWLTVATGACPISAADQQIRNVYRARSRALESSRTAGGNRQRPATELHRLVLQTNAQGARPCN
ncbi:hypothetical protein J2X20_000475 [Pelomonas saccharophila]|uniref:Uncharacterized protein n=1 Tax=Roseateles saccharophilus TaxID=304 RepID=A0ABU1YI17_ROSSA|nr:hypothetical protein [Roseateles saccharophilus]MDR7267846.1 hypothetical protein [Roseateles saccharophilus]